MVGRKPLPTRLKLLKGTARKHRMRNDEPTPGAGNVSPPDHLSVAACRQWDLTCPHLMAAGVMTDLDVHALALYCEAFARWAMANKQIEKYGPVVMAKSGFPTQSPYVAISNMAFEQMRGMLVEFGMTPSSRTRVGTVKSAKGERNPFADM